LSSASCSIFLRGTSGGLGDDRFEFDGTMRVSCAPKQLNYQWTFSYLTGFTGSGGFSFLFLSFRLPATLSLARRAGTKLRKKNPVYPVYD
jgi:hypothetical protein